MSDARLPMLGLVIVAILLLGLAIRGEFHPLASSLSSEEEARAAPSEAIELETQFRNAVALLHTRHYESAAQLFGEIVLRAPWMPEAETNLAFALVGLERYAQAQAHFERALVLNDRQLNAYYGLAISREKLGDLDSALGAMRVYVHLANADDPYLNKAWAAIWEWESARSVTTKTAIHE